MTANVVLRLWYDELVRLRACFGGQPPLETGGEGGAGDGDRTRDIKLGKLAFYR
jgi:hypothetical protein